MLMTINSDTLTMMTTAIIFKTWCCKPKQIHTVKPVFNGYSDEEDTHPSSDKFEERCHIFPC